MTFENRNTETLSSRTYDEPVYTSGLAAKKLGISPHTLRLYETEGLIIPFKTETGRRLYSDLELDKTRNIRRMIKEEGHIFEGIRRLIALVPCWKIRDCGRKDRNQCNACREKTRPCWSTEEKCLHSLPSCRYCPVYQNIISSEDIYSIINS